MYWLRRPPYIRYFVAALIVALGVFMEFRRPQAVLHPYASESIPRGVQLESAPIVWREIAAGILPTVEVSGATVRAVPSGAPLLPSDVGDLPVPPEGWWAVEVPLPARATAGQTIQIVVLPEGRAVPGLVLDPAMGADEFGFTDDVGLVALPGEDAAVVVLAVAEGLVGVVLEP